MMAVSDPFGEGAAHLWFSSPVGMTVPSKRGTPAAGTASGPKAMPAEGVPGDDPLARTAVDVSARWCCIRSCWTGAQQVG